MMRLNVTVQTSSRSETLLVPVAEGATVSQLCTDIERRVAKIFGSNDFKVSCLRLGKADGPRLDSDDPVQDVLTQSDDVFAERAPTITETCVYSPDKTDPSREEAQVAAPAAVGQPTLTAQAASSSAPPSAQLAVPPQEQLGRDASYMFNIMDTNKDGVVDKNEFKTAVMSGALQADTDLEQLAELEKMTLTSLKARASKMGCNAQAINHVDDAEDPKEAAIDLILLAKAATLDVDPEQVAEFKEMTLKTLKVEAIEIGCSKEAVNDVDASDDPKKAIVDLIRKIKVIVAGIYRDSQKHNVVVDQSDSMVTCIFPSSDQSKRAKLCGRKLIFDDPSGSEAEVLENGDIRLTDGGLWTKQVDLFSRQSYLEVIMRSLASEREQNRDAPRVSPPISPRSHTIQQAATKEQPIVCDEREAILDIDRQRVLIIGSVGDGKSTLVNHLIEETETRAVASTQVTGTTKGVTPYRGKKSRVILDTPGIGDGTVPPLKLLAMIEQVLCRHGPGVDYVVITTSLLTPVLDLGIQIVSTLVEKGFHKEGGGSEWKSIIVCGTKKDRAAEIDVQSFQCKVDVFYQDAPANTGMSVMVGFEIDKDNHTSYDSTGLDDAMKENHKTKFHKVDPMELAARFAAQLGFENQEEEFANQLITFRGKIEDDSSKLEKALIAFSERQKEIDDLVQKWLKELRRGNLNREQAIALQSFFAREVSRAWQKEAQSVESCELFDIARMEADYQALAHSKTFCLQMRAAFEDSHRTWLRGETPESLTKIAREEGIGKEFLDKCGRDKKAVIQSIAATRAKHDMSAVDAMAMTSASGKDPMTLASLKGMTLAELKKSARSIGIDQEAVDASDNCKDPEDAVIQKILVRKLALKMKAVAPPCPVASSAASESWDIFCCHTKSSVKWSCNDFVHIHLWDFFNRSGLRAFYDAASLPGQEIDGCLQAAATTKVMMVVLDDLAPSSWMMKEIRVALDLGIPVQTVYRKDTFSWQEVGKNAWEKRNVDAELVQGAFKLPSIEMVCTPVYLYAARFNLLHIIRGLVSNRTA